MIHFFFTLAVAWAQFRMGPQNNAVVDGTLDTAWRIETGSQISSSPTTDGGTLYIGNNAGTLYAIDSQSGKTLWKAQVPNPLMSAPLIYNDLVIVGEGDPTSHSSSPSEPEVVGQGPSALLAFNRFTGEKRWETSLSGSAMPTPAIIDGILVNHDGAGWINGMDPATGSKRYQHWLGSMASMSAALPVDGGDYITLGVGSNAAWRVHADGGATVWRTSFPRGSSGIGDCPPVTDGKRIYCDYIAPVLPDRFTVIGDLSVERVYALDVATGASLWDSSLEAGMLGIRNEAAIPLIDGDMLYLGSALVPWMHAMDTATGTMRWETPLHGMVKGGLVDVGGILYFGDYAGYLWALDAKNGRVIGDKQMHTAFNVGSPIVIGRTLIIGSDSGTVIAEPLQVIRSAHDS